MSEEEDGFAYIRPNPRKGDVLFGPDSALWRLDADLEFIPGKDITYRVGYRRAGRILVEWVASHGEQDFLVFPICHAYRHHVELTLKELIWLGCNVVEREPTARERELSIGTHNLQALWTAYKRISLEVETMTATAEIVKEDKDGIDSYIDQLDAIDAGSFSFRYPRRKDGMDSIQSVQKINLGRFSEHMEKLCTYLEGHTDYYGYLIQQREDYLDEFAPY